MQDLEKLKFPIGKFHRPTDFTEDLVRSWIEIIRTFPIEVEKAVADISEEQLDAKYRPDGWTIRQLVHHCADSHMNSFIRFKLTMTEELPTIRPYFEDRWAEMSDYLELSIDPSLKILNGLHERWAKLLDDLKTQDLAKEFVHPEHGWKMTLGANIALYAWHCEHHLAHMYQALESKGKYN